MYHYRAIYVHVFQFSSTINDDRYRATILNDDEKRWCVYGIALNFFFVRAVQTYLEENISKEYDNLKKSHNIHVQTAHNFPSKIYPHDLHYENINNNETKVRSKFNFEVKSHVDFGKLFLQNHMAKFNCYDSCDASAMLNLLERIPIFSNPVQNAAKIIRKDRNCWAHCNLKEWNETDFHQKIENMKQLVKKLSLKTEDEVLNDINHWKDEALKLRINVRTLCEKLKDHIEYKKLPQETLDKFLNCIKEIDQLKRRVDKNEDKFDQLYQSIINDFDNCDICDSDIDLHYQKFDPQTRKWLINDFSAWFDEPGESRAFVFMGDAGVGKTVMSAAIAQRAKDYGKLGAAFFCRHYDGTRRDPKSLLASVAYQLGKHFPDYLKLLGGVSEIKKQRNDTTLGVQELFTKFFDDPLWKLETFSKTLIVIDALDEADYDSKNEFFDVVTFRFPKLPQWLLFFITTRPVDFTQFTLKNYNPSVKICSGDASNAKAYEKHEQDIQTFLENQVDFTGKSFSAKEITKNCKGMFLFAHYLVKTLKDSSETDLEKCPQDIDGYFLNNFKRIYEKVGKDFYKKLLGCAVVAPSPLPSSFIPFLLKKENLNLDEQEVIDAISLFFSFGEEKFTFLHNLIPDWLTDKKRASRKFVIDKAAAQVFFKEIVIEVLTSFLENGLPFNDSDENSLVCYILEIEFRYLFHLSTENSELSRIFFQCFTNCEFLKQRIQSSTSGIFTILNDIHFAIGNIELKEDEKQTVKELLSILENDRFYLVNNPHLLDSSLSRLSSKVRQAFISQHSNQFRLSNIISGDNIHIKCDVYAYSTDRTLLAGGKGNVLYLFETSFFQQKYGPFQLNVDKIHCLAFSPDDKWIFFGTLRFWFSVDERMTVEKTQFPQTDTFYNWASFVEHEHVNYIAVRAEKVECPPDDECIFSVTPEKYPTSFKHQIWDVKTGDHVFKLMCESDLNNQWKLNSFFYIWHFFPYTLYETFFRKLSPKELLRHCLVDFFYAFKPNVKFCDQGIYFDLFFKGNMVWPSNLNRRFELLKDRVSIVKEESVFIHSIPISLHNLIWGDIVCLSSDKNWLLLKHECEFHLYNFDHSQDHDEVHLKDDTAETSYDSFKLHGVMEGNSDIFGFTHNNHAIIYKNRETLFAWFLDSNEHFESVSTFSLLLCMEEKVVFRSKGEEKMISLQDFPAHFLNSNFHEDNVAFSKLETFDANKCRFSYDTRYFVKCSNSELKMFSADSSFSTSEIVHKLKNGESDFHFVLFSPDSSLILFCTNNKDFRSQTIYVWFVKDKDLKLFLPENYLIEVDTCCSSMNNRIIILCRGTSIWIYDYDGNVASEPITRSFQLGSKLEKCSHCILSSDDKMLACCVENRIIFYELLSAPEKASQFKHSCMVKCCYFMGRNKYVLFQDIAGYMFMFDLSQWKLVTHFKADASVKIFKFTDYKITCIQPNGKINFLAIRGLKDWSGKDYNLPYNLYVSDFAPFTNSDDDDYGNYSESSQSESNKSDDKMV
ncbi:uncharacterized protein LOC124447731 isoform X2 [Xenia sp. Carnegie-2017]|uniref:uncharacterized protein LOC124447731 isoform X2 n=1 Tax=Xenia sp. Carnegie-2017 TaxID=2897299 RepID=UPI001F037EBB|nr:uncharacterized protein LOC124447731 isoform X2 [Xenia sp. Carnegie-2017]